MEIEVLKSVVLCAQESHFREDASRNGNDTLKALDASLFFGSQCKMGCRKVLYSMRRTLIFETRLR